MLAARGLLADGKKALLHLAPGTKEDTASCREFFRDLRRRGLPDPLLVVSDGAPGMIGAIEECFPRALRQRCLAHKMRNLASKVPENVWPEFKARAALAIGPPRRLWRDCCATISGRPTVAICRAWWPASRMTLRPASRISSSRSATAERSAPRARDGGGTAGR